MKRILLATLLLASCSQGGAPDIQVKDAWARATVAGQSSGAAYMTIANRGSGDDRLIAVSAPIPATAMVHSTSSQGGVSSMSAMDAGLDLPAGGMVELKPLRSHVMISGLSGPLKAGSTLPLTLQFERSGKRAVQVRIIDATSTGPR